MKYISLTITALVLLAACAAPADKETLYNTKASVTKNDSLPFNPLEWPVITTVMNKDAHTMSTLYGNDVAVTYARSGNGQSYPKGAVLSLVTWTQQEDKRWFGANIPQKIQGVEVVTFDSTTDEPFYRNYSGVPLRFTATDSASSVISRVNYITSQRISVIP